MHVLVMAQLFPPDMGGGSTRAYNMVKGLALLGHKLTVVTAFPHYPTGRIPDEYKWRLLSIENKAGIRIIRTFVPPVASKGIARRLVLFLSFSISSLFALPFVKRLGAIWAANPNIISAYPALVYSFFKKCPVILNVDDLWPEELYNLEMLSSHLFRKIAELVSKVAYSKSMAITPISPAYTNVITEKYGITPAKIHVIPAGVDLDNFNDSADKRVTRRDTFTALYIGALSPAYDFDNVLKAALLLSSHTQIRIVIQGDGELGEYLILKVKEMNLTNVTIIQKVVSRTRVAEILSSADALLLPLKGANYTGISSKLYEYQAAGKPIICCSGGPSASYVQQTNSGIVVKPGDSTGLSESILRLFDDRKLSSNLGKAGRRYVERNLSLGKISIKMENLFKSVARARKDIVAENCAWI